MKKRRASRDEDNDVPVVPAWRRWLFAAGLIAAGAGGLAFSIVDLTGWITALRSGSAIVATDSGVFGAPPLALCIAMLALMFFTLPTVRIGRWQLDEMVFAAILISAAIAFTLLAFGGIAVDIVMQRHGYRICSSDTGIRINFKTWARAGQPCPAA